MGQQVKGYRRNAEASYAKKKRLNTGAIGALTTAALGVGLERSPYTYCPERGGKERRRPNFAAKAKPKPQSKQPEKGERKRGCDMPEEGYRGRRERNRQGWSDEVNPPDQYGWEASGVERAEKVYGKSEGRGKERRKRVEQVRLGEGYETNGRGRKGSRKQGYVVYGEYVKALVRERPKRETEPEENAEEERRKSMEERGRVQEDGERKYREGDKVRVKRERRLRRYEVEVGRKVTRERVNRAEVRAMVGRRPERQRRYKVMASGERPYREKRMEEDDKEVERRVSKKRRKALEVEGKTPSRDGLGAEAKAKLKSQRKHTNQGMRDPTGEMVGTRPPQGDLTPTTGGEATIGSEDLARTPRVDLGGRSRKSRKRVGKAVEKSRKPVDPKVRTLGRAVVVVRVGLRKMERRRVKRRVRKREGAGRKHKQVRRDFVGRMKYQARKSKYGRKGAAAKQAGLDGSGARAPRGEDLGRKGWGKRGGKRGGKRKGKRLPQGGKGNSPDGVELSTVRGGYYGYKVTVIGTRGGSRRTKKSVRWRGTVPKSTKGARIGSAEGVAKTTVGTMGVRVEYCYELGESDEG
jgi:hypothetical protein